MTQPAKPTLPMQFEDCSFEIASRRLVRAGRVVALEPKMYELLEILIERRPAVVTNEELDELLWPKVYVARTSLTRLVSELRALLGDDAREARFIRTVYKRGYAFCASVRGADADPQSSIHLIWRDRRLPLHEGVQVLGRGDDCDLIIDAATVSRRHASIAVREETVRIEDLKSKNGTHVDGIAISETITLTDGAEISLGREPLTLYKRNPDAVTVASGPAGTSKQLRGAPET